MRANQLFTRHDDNPILTSAQWPYTVNAVFNPGAAIGPDGETILLVRVEDRSGISHLTVARSSDGRSGWEIDTRPSLEPRRDRYEEAGGLEDPRVTRIGDEYLIAHTSLSRGGPLVGLTSTRDFEEFHHIGVMSPPENKDAALFPETIDGRYAILHRPVFAGSRAEAHIWISFSPDLEHWGDHRILMETRQPWKWDGLKIGAGPPPLHTDRGWLLAFHGVKATAAGSLYRLGLAVLDLEDPTRVVARTDEWVFGPEAAYELTGDVPGVVFPCGWIVDGDEVRMYYGAADSCVALATASVERLLDFAFSHSIVDQ